MLAAPKALLACLTCAFYYKVIYYIPPLANRQNCSIVEHATSMNSFKNIWRAVISTYYEIKALDISAIRVEEIDVNKKIVVVRSRGARAVLKLSIAEAIADPSIVANLLSAQACWLGYYAGLIYDIGEIQRQKQLLKSVDSDFSLKFNKGKYKIVSQGRKGEITYVEIATQVVRSNYPIEIVQDDLVISSFDTSQACYIGILAGIHAAKYGFNINFRQKKRFMLRVIK